LIPQPYSDRKSSKAGDAFCEVVGDLSNLENEWIRPIAEPCYPDPLDDSFSKIQHFRRPTPREANQLRFAVDLWASVDIRKPVHPQVADALRRMAQFLIEQAARIGEDGVSYCDEDDSAECTAEVEKAGVA